MDLGRSEMEEGIFLMLIKIDGETGTLFETY